LVEETSIARKTGPADEYSFEGLKREGIRLAQELSGLTWTDYNVHDPGVTILEQLCYALTDLMYRTEFDTADYLTGEDGEIDFEQQALSLPEVIFPGEAVTLNDYRKIFFDGIPEIDNVWIEPITDGMVRGLYRVYVQLNEDVEERGESGRQQVIEKVHSLYAANRNLCEDLHEVVIVNTRHYTLHGTVEIDSAREPADILAEVYFTASRYAASPIEFLQYEDVLREDKPISEVFTGPLTEHVYIDESTLNHSRESVTISELIGLINEIEGVRFVDDLSFMDDAGEAMESIPFDPLDFVPHILFPQTGQDIGVKLLKNEREYSVSLRAVRAEFDRLNSEYRALRQARQDFSELVEPPEGEHRNLGEYYSIQNHFPDTYGINRYGIPESSSSGRKAQAKQLKAYLLVFEQIMANYLANLQGIPRLFSLDEQLHQSYFQQQLNNRNVPNIEGLFQEDAGAMIDQLFAQFDDFGDRRSRVLDYLLGLYGEKFTQNSLRRFNYYFTPQEMEDEVIRNKLNLLKLVGGLM
jgi:hypothetical protein